MTRRSPYGMIIRACSEQALTESSLDHIMWMKSVKRAEQQAEEAQARLLNKGKPS